MMLRSNLSLMNRIPPANDDGRRISLFHFMNSVRLYPGVYSCSIDSFLGTMGIYYGTDRCYYGWGK